jgi:hypothetical protein
MANGHWPFHLKIDGQTRKDAMISHLEIRQELGEHTWCEVHFRLLDEQKPPIADYLGKSLEFITFEEFAAEVSLFTGLVAEAALEFGLRGDFIARLRAVTKTYLLQLTPEEDYFYKKNLREVAAKVTGEDGVDLQFTADGEFARMNYVQWDESDFEFLRRIADDQGCAFRPTPTGLEIQRGFHGGYCKVAMSKDPPPYVSKADGNEIIVKTTQASASDVLTRMGFTAQPGSNKDYIFLAQDDNEKARLFGQQN